MSKTPTTHVTRYHLNTGSTVIFRATAANHEKHAL